MVVLDACGVGALPDAAKYGDAGTNTLAHLALQVGGLRLPALGALGLGSILALQGMNPAPAPVLHGRLAPLGPGKDSVAGHWELMGVVMPAPLPTYPSGFPVEVIEILKLVSGREVICNLPCDGIRAIEDFGAAHLHTVALIVYTSQDSVLQLAAHVDVLAPEELYEICSGVRATLSEEHALGRVIARPFAGSVGCFERIEGRRDYSLAPPTRSYLEEVQASGLPVHTVGKAGQLFAGVGIDVQHPGSTNARALTQTTELMRSIDRGLVFTNLVETDELYGHRRDAGGFHRALREIDACLKAWLAIQGPEDLLILTADHGCDVTSPGPDHTREHVLLLAAFPGHGSRRYNGRFADGGASVLRWLTGRRASELPGEPFA